MTCGSRPTGIKGNRGGEGSRFSSHSEKLLSPRRPSRWDNPPSGHCLYPSQSPQGTITHLWSLCPRTSPSPLPPQKGAGLELSASISSLLNWA